MKYLPLVILALLVIGLFAGCASTTEPPVGGDGADATANVAAEADSAVDSAVIEDTEEVEIGEMI